VFSFWCCSLNPVSFLRPDAGDPNSSRQLEDGANGARQREPRSLSRPSPSANLAGVWKGEPLSREVRGLQVHPNRNRGVVAFIRGGTACLKMIMLDAVYVGITVLFFAAFALYARGCEKL
jgi:hypothetical protein